MKVLEAGCMCCSKKIGCAKSHVISTPSMPIPCCCCKNEVGKCDNYCETCGPITGNPKLFSKPLLQAKDPEKFVEAVNATLAGFRGGAPTTAEEMDR